jgi:hypothetical protein
MTQNDPETGKNKNERGRQLLDLSDKELQIVCQTSASVFAAVRSTH